MIKIFWRAILGGLLLAAPAYSQTVPLSKNVQMVLCGTYSAGVFTPGSCSSGGGGGTVTQGTAAAAAGAWPIYLVQGTTANSSGNPIFVQLTAGAAAIGAVNVNTWAGGTLGAMANYGTSPGAVLVPGVNAFITNSPAITGTVTANAGTNLNTSLLALESGGNLATLAGAVSSSTMAVKTAAGAVAAGAFVSGSVLSGAYADGSLVTVGLKADAATCATSNTMMACLRQLDADIKAAIAAQSGTGVDIGGVDQIGTWTVQPGNTANTTPWLTTPSPATSGGLSVFFLQPTASDNHAVIKNGAGQVYHVKATNNSATVNYLRLYNAGTGFNGCNSATGLVDQWAIPASTSGAGLVEDFTIGVAFGTGISICVTSAYATTDTTNATASAISLSIGYK